MAYSMSDLLQLVVSEGSSDLHIRVGVPPTIRVHGILHRVEGPPCRPEDTEELMRSITSDDHIQHVRERGGADFGFAFGEAARFRVSVFKEKGNFAMVLRQIPSKLLTMEQIGIPPSAKELLYKPRGLVLVTGPTGSGKTTTLASMLNIINEERDEAHIITIEDPIEYYHKHKKAVVTQREITWTCRTSRKGCGALCGRTRTSCWSVKCATWKPLKLPSPRRKRATWSLAPCTPPARPRRLTGS
jgi:twitching motility protein PilT